jgi:hypothetical protein
MPGSGPRCHDPVATSSHHAPAGEPHFRRRIAIAPPLAETQATSPDQPKITPSTAIVATKSRRQSSVRRQLRRPEQPLPRTPPRQIPIDGTLLTQPPRVPSSEAFGRRRRRHHHRRVGHDLTASETLHDSRRSRGHIEPPESGRKQTTCLGSAIGGGRKAKIRSVQRVPSPSAQPLVDPRRRRPSRRRHARAVRRRERRVLSWLSSGVMMAPETPRIVWPV